MRSSTDVARWNQASEVDRLTQRLSQLLDVEWPELPRTLPEAFTPLADVEETEDGYRVQADLPGVQRRDIKIDVDDRRLTISGERPEQQRAGWMRRQMRSWGRFHYEVVLPDQVDEDRVEATLKDGVLQVLVPKSSGGERRRVEVK